MISVQPYPWKYVRTCIALKVNYFMFCTLADLDFFFLNIPVNYWTTIIVIVHKLIMSRHYGTTYERMYVLHTTLVLREPSDYRVCDNNNIIINQSAGDVLSLIAHYTHNVRTRTIRVVRRPRARLPKGKYTSRSGVSATTRWMKHSAYPFLIPAVFGCGCYAHDARWRCE